ncbi:MAG: hypothetical protein CR988_07760 [Treponema sp.]|nr:MAG: hypothetical protein CR988_07760 [Treponema sp.]
MKNYFRILLPVFFTVLSYCCLSFFFGSKGLYVQKTLQKHKELMKEHLNELYLTGAKLDECIANLSYDYDTIKVYANALGYVNEGEMMIKLANFKAKVNHEYSAGKPIVLGEIEFMPDKTLKTMAVSVGILVALLQLFFAFRESKNYDYSESFAEFC